MINRREFLASTTIAMVAPRAVVASAEREQRWEPDGVGSLARIGVLTPDDDPVPESEMRMMAPDGVSIHASRVLWKNGNWSSFADGAPSAAQFYDNGEANSRFRRLGMGIGWVSIRS